MATSGKSGRSRPARETTIRGRVLSDLNATFEPFQTFCRDDPKVRRYRNPAIQGTVVGAKS
jgi:hypothetical protein